MSLTTLTVTVYMIAQGLAPSFWGAISDVTGRRVVFIGTFIVYMIANVALAVSQNYGDSWPFAPCRLSAAQQLSRSVWRI